MMNHEWFILSKLSWIQSAFQLGRDADTVIWCDKEFIKQHNLLSIHGEPGVIKPDYYHESRIFKFNILRDQIEDAEQNGERPEATGGERILFI